MDLLYLLLQQQHRLIALKTCHLIKEIANLPNISQQAISFQFFNRDILLFQQVMHCSPLFLLAAETCTGPTTCRFAYARILSR